MKLHLLQLVYFEKNSSKNYKKASYLLENLATAEKPIPVEDVDVTVTMDAELKTMEDNNPTLLMKGIF